MKNPRLYLFSSVFWLSVSCNNNEYTELEVGNYWLNDFQQAPIQNARLYKGKLYCNSINQQTGDFLYCLDLIDGRVKWKVPVDNFASAPVLINDKAIYYTTLVGHTYCVSLDGNILNSIKFSNSYSGQRINTFNGNLIMNSVVNGAKEFDRDSLKEVFHYEFRGKDGLSALS